MAPTADTMTVRRPTFDFADLPRTWLAGSAAATHAGNAGHVFIPLGEEFFIDSVKEFRSQANEQRRSEINAFIGQETVHKRAHQTLWDHLTSQGVPVERYAAFITWLRKAEPRVPAKLRLSITAALEHYTAAFADSFVTEDLTEAVPDEMARMLAWHGLEELEHRSVAFDVMVDNDTGYGLRIIGFALATGLFIVVPAVGTVMFALADRNTDVSPQQPASSDTAATGTEQGQHQPDTRAMVSMAGRFARRTLGHLADYLRPGFHPSQIPVPPGAAQWEQALAEHTSR